MLFEGVGAYSMLGSMRNARSNLVGKPKRDLGTSRKRWQYSIAEDLQGLRCKNFERINLV
jgi:hypothetical protein